MHNLSYEKDSYEKNNEENNEELKIIYTPIQLMAKKQWRKRVEVEEKKQKKKNAIIKIFAFIFFILVSIIVILDSAINTSPELVLIGISILAIVIAYEYYKDWKRKNENNN